MPGVTPPPAPGQHDLPRAVESSMKGPSISRVPSVPVLFDDEPSTPDEGLNNTEDDLPEILIEPLHVLDHVSLKWGLGLAQKRGDEKRDVKAPPTPAAKKEPVADSPVSAAPPSSSGEGYVRLMGLLSSGSSWESSINLTDLTKPGGIVIGRDGSCCQISLPEGCISRQHARLELTPMGVIITDLNSTNGTFVNGRRLTLYDQPTVLRDGSIMALGDITLRVEIMDKPGVFPSAP